MLQWLTEMRPPTVNQLTYPKTAQQDTTDSHPKLQERKTSICRLQGYETKTSQAGKVSGLWTHAILDFYLNFTDPGQSMSQFLGMPLSWLIA